MRLYKIAGKTVPGIWINEFLDLMAEGVRFPVNGVEPFLVNEKEGVDKRRIPDPGEGWRLIDQATDTPQQGDEIWRPISKDWAGRMYPCDTDYLKDSHYRRRVEPKAGRWVRCKNGYQFVDGPPNYYPWYEELPEIGEWMAGPGRGNNYLLPVGTEIDVRGSNVTAKVVAMVAHQMRSTADALRNKTTSNAVWQKNGGNENFVHEFADEPYRVTKYPDPPSDEQGCAT